MSKYDGLGLGLDECVELQWSGSESGWVCGIMMVRVWVWIGVWNYDGPGLGLDGCVEL